VTGGARPRTRPRTRPDRRRIQSLVVRPARDADLLACAQIWSDSIEDYVRRLNQPWFGGDLEPLRRLLAHFLRTDPGRFAVVTDPRGGGQVLGFASATVRDGAWFLGMLFVLPEVQQAGVGRRLLERVLPAGVTRIGLDDAGATSQPDPLPTLATATDSVQPISNALYSQYGMVPRAPVFNLVGRPDRPEVFAAVPSGVHLVQSPLDARSDDVAALDTVDRAVLGYVHPQDHGFLAEERRRLFVARSERGEPLGYGYIAPSGRFGPIAAIDTSLLVPIAGHLLTSVRAPGAYATWMPGPASDLFVALLRAGFRFESFPALLLWNRPTVDFGRYVPNSLALL
jgi:GNAT superfamily N-acetyltransferase